MEPCMKVRNLSLGEWVWVDESVWLIYEPEEILVSSSSSSSLSLSLSLFSRVDLCDY